MPTISRYLIRAALVWLAAGISLFFLAALGAGPIRSFAALPVAVHFLTVGWITQLAFGVAFWMFPAAMRGPRPGRRTMTGSFYLLNGGLALRVSAELLSVPQLAAWSAGMQFASILLFVAVIWPRVRARA